MTKHRASAGPLTGRLCLATRLAAALALAAASAGAGGSDYIDWSVSDGGIAGPLGGLEGDPQRGLQLVVDRNRGNCLACHRIPIPGEDFQGDIGPPLQGVASRLSVPQIRLRIVDERQLNPDTIMPGYYRNPAVLNRVAPGFEGKTYFTPQQVEDVVAWIATLKQP